MAGLAAKTMEGRLRAGQVVQVLGLDFRQQQLPAHVRGKSLELLADFADRFVIVTAFAFGLGDGVIRLRLDLPVAAVVERAERFGDHRGDAYAARPHEEMKQA